MQSIDKLRNLLVMAAQDGRLTASEIGFLTDRCHRWGVSDAMFAESIEYALSPDASVAIPPRKSDRLAMLKEFLNMMAADGDLAEREMELFALIAARMEISDQELNELIDSLTQ